MPPAPMGATISYGPRRLPGPRDMGCQEDRAIVTDLIERFCDPDANQSARWNTDVCTAGPPLTNRMLSLGAPTGRTVPPGRTGSESDPAVHRERWDSRAYAKPKSLALVCLRQVRRNRGGRAAARRMPPSARTESWHLTGLRCDVVHHVVRTVGVAAHAAGHMVKAEGT